LEDAPFGFAGASPSHVNVQFLRRSALPHPGHLLPGAGKLTRHVTGTATNAVAPGKLIEVAYSHVQARANTGPDAPGPPCDLPQGSGTPGLSLVANRNGPLDNQA
jgi:hypothetical protein